jgi:hypothetical protein
MWGRSRILWPISVHMIEDRKMERRIFDCILFNGEFDVLAIRLHELKDVVYRHVIVESNITFSGLAKTGPMFDHSHPLIREFSKKIDHILVDDMPETNNAWEREAWQRNAIARGLKFANDNDIILMSDVDEIPRAECLKDAIENLRSSAFGFRMKSYYFFLNYKNINGHPNDIWAVASEFKILREYNPDTLRYKIRDGSVAAKIYEDGGWHFSYLGDDAAVKRKISSFSHQEFNNDYYTSRVKISEIISKSADLFERPGFKWEVVQDSDLPAWVLANRENMQNLFVAPQPKINPSAQYVEESDKIFWHQYMSFYERFLAARNPHAILEFGVSRGASIRMWRTRYPAAKLVGVDILKIQPDWPADEQISYEQVDQGDDQQIQAMFRRLGMKFDLITEDGSHIPEHQARCLVLSLPYLSSGGLYFLEDIHTSHPGNAYSKDRPRARNALKVLLAIQNLRDIGRKVDWDFATQMAEEGFFTASDILDLDRQIATIALYRRTSLPLRCYSCKKSDFDYGAWKCRCGVSLFGDSDSMTIVLEKR